MDRAVFLASAAAALISPTPKASPSPAATPKPWDECDKTQSLPYDRPIDVSMQVLDGPDFHLMNFRGRAVIMNIFTTWCGPCNEEQPYFVDLAARYAADGLSIIGINDGEPDNAVRRYRKRYGITYPIAMDRHSGFTQALEHGYNAGNRLYPVSIFISPTGYLYCYKRGSMEKAELDYRVQKFLADASPTLMTVPQATPTP